MGRPEWPLERLLAGIDVSLSSGIMDEHEAHALADRCAFKAGTAAGKGLEGEAMDWAGIAIKLYENLAYKNGTKSERFLESAIMLRATLIGKLGERANDPIRDGIKLKEWFLGRFHVRGSGIDRVDDLGKGFAVATRRLQNPSPRIIAMYKIVLEIGTCYSCHQGSACIAIVVSSGEPFIVCEGCFTEWPVPQAFLARKNATFETHGRYE